MRCDFAGQYLYKVMSGTNRITVTSGGLTGGFLCDELHLSRVARGISIKGAQALLCLHGGVNAGGGVLPDGGYQDFLVNESTSTALGGYLVERLVSE